MSQLQCKEDHEVQEQGYVSRRCCIGIVGHGGDHMDCNGQTWRTQPPSQQPERRPVKCAAEVTGLIQQALEELHGLSTYELSSAVAFRHRGTIEQVQKQLIGARNTMAGLSLLLGKEGA